MGVALGDTTAHPGETIGRHKNIRDATNVQRAVIAIGLAKDLSVDSYQLLCLDRR